MTVNGYANISSTPLRALALTCTTMQAVKYRLLGSASSNGGKARAGAKA